MNQTTIFKALLLAGLMASSCQAGRRHQVTIVRQAAEQAERGPSTAQKVLYVALGVGAIAGIMLLGHKIHSWEREQSVKHRERLIGATSNANVASINAQGESTRQIMGTDMGTGGTRHLVVDATNRAPSPYGTMDYRHLSSGSYVGDLFGGILGGVARGLGARR